MRFGIENIYLRHHCTETRRTQAHNDKALCNPVVIIFTAQIVAAFMFLHINTMSLPWSASTSSAATEHGTGRMAQAFLCTMPGESNEHTPIRTDAQRIQLIRNLLQSSSMTKANRPIDEGRFFIGGDMNTLSTKPESKDNKPERKDDKDVTDEQPQKKIKRKHTKATHVKKTQNIKPRSARQLQRMFDPKAVPRRPRGAISTSSSYYTSDLDVTSSDDS